MKLAFILVIIAVTACHGYSAPVSGGDKADAEIQLSKLALASPKRAVNPEHVIRKREIYVTMQDRAQSVCIGMCMYYEKHSYFKCENRCRIGMPRRSFRSNWEENRH